MVVPDDDHHEGQNMLYYVIINYKYLIKIKFEWQFV
jgi:hypothetical protein